MGRRRVGMDSRLAVLAVELARSTDIPQDDMTSVLAGLDRVLKALPDGFSLTVTGPDWSYQIDREVD